MAAPLIPLAVRAATTLVPKAVKLGKKLVKSFTDDSAGATLFKAEAAVAGSAAVVGAAKGVKKNMSESFDSTPGEITIPETDRKKKQ